jgi:DNA polymerase III subunit epsilon
LILLSFDLESTGLDTANDDVIEFGAVLWSSTQKKCLDNQGMLVKTDKTITPEITKITGITQAAVNRFGYEQDSVLDIIIDMIQSSDAVIGYNVRRFDRKLLQSWAARRGHTVPEKVWIDLYADLPWDVPVGKLSHVAADHGILNLFPHSALADCQTVLAIASKYDANLLLERAQSPVVILRSLEDRSNNEAVKKAKFRWNPANKIWWKAVKEADVEQVIANCGIRVEIDKEHTQEELDI